MTLVKAHATEFSEEFGFFANGNVRFMDGTVIQASSRLHLSPVLKVLAHWMDKTAKVSCAVADTPLKKVVGLQSYQTLAPKEGLYFPYEDYMDVTFHQGSVPFGLDVIFLRDFHVAQLERNTIVGSTDRWRCERCDGVIEVNANFCEKHGIDEGDQVLISAVSEQDIKELEYQRVADLRAMELAI
jgi:uncharacterized membrane protein (UPF0127 family)